MYTTIYIQMYASICCIILNYYCSNILFTIIQSHLCTIKLLISSVPIELLVSLKWFQFRNLEMPQKFHDTSSFSIGNCIVVTIGTYLVLKEKLNQNVWWKVLRLLPTSFYAKYIFIILILSIFERQ